MTLRFPLIATALAAFLFLGAGCSDNKMKAERDSLLSDNKSLAEKLQASDQAHQADQAKIDALTRQITAAPAAAPAETGTPSMTGGPLELTGLPGRSAPRTTSTPAKPTTPVKAATTTRVKLPGEVFFDSGKTTLNAAAKKTLDTMAATLKKSYAGDKIIVEGFSDSTPVKNTALKSNDALSAARATSVMKYLATKGIAEKNMTVKSMGDADPKSKTDQSLNRRVEVVVVK